MPVVGWEATCSLVERKLWCPANLQSGTPARHFQKGLPSHFSWVFQASNLIVSLLFVLCIGAVPVTSSCCKHAPLHRKLYVSRAPFSDLVRIRIPHSLQFTYCCFWTLRKCPISQASIPVIHHDSRQLFHLIKGCLLDILSNCDDGPATVHGGHTVIFCRISSWV